MAFQVAHAAAVPRTPLPAAVPRRAGFVHVDTTFDGEFAHIARWPRRPEVASAVNHLSASIKARATGAQYARRAQSQAGCACACEAHWAGRSVFRPRSADRLPLPALQREHYRHMSRGTPTRCAAVKQSATPLYIFGLK